jgi:hypothetical protein
MVLLHVLAAILLGMSIISGGRPEASKCNLNFQSAMFDWSRWVKNGEPSGAFSKANIVATIV